MEGDVVLAHEFDIADVGRALVGAPPALPVAIRLGVGPFPGGGDVFDRRVEPDVEDLVLEARPRQAVAGDGHAPGQVAGDPTVDQPLVQVLVGDRARQVGPVGVAVDPGADALGHPGLQQIEMAGLAHLQVPRAGDHRIGVLQVDRVEQRAAVVALVAARLLVVADRARALDVTVRQEPLVVDRIDHLVEAFLDQAPVLQHVGEMLGQLVVLRRGRAAEPVPGQAEGAADVVLQDVLLLAVCHHVLAGGGGGQLGRRAMLVGGADI